MDPMNAYDNKGSLRYLMLLTVVAVMAVIFHCALHGGVCLGDGAGSVDCHFRDISDQNPRQGHVAGRAGDLAFVFSGFPDIPGAGGCDWECKDVLDLCLVQFCGLDLCGGMGSGDQGKDA